MAKAEFDRIPGEYDEVVNASYQKVLMRRAHALGITRKHAKELVDYLGKKYLAGREIEVIFGASDRSTAYGAQKIDGKLKIEFPAAFVRPGLGLRAGVVLHEFVHLMGEWQHDVKFAQQMDNLLYTERPMWDKPFNPPDEEKPKSFSRINKINCPECGKVAVEKTHIRLNKRLISLLQCGHAMAKETLDEATKDALENYTAKDGSQLFPFQKEGVRFLEKANGRAILNDEMGLGKTVQGVVFCHLHRDRVAPTLVVCKSSLVRQWQKAIYNWTGGEIWIQIIQTGRDIPLPGMKWYIVSYDLLARLDESFFDFPFNSVILDEVQSIKNHSAKRTNNVRKLTMLREYIIPMSGTLAKNNAGELFPACNIVAPEKFPTQAGFIRDHCWAYAGMYGAKVGGLKNPERWHEVTKDMILRRNKKDVLKELPPKTRTTTFFDLSEELEEQYLRILDEFIEAYEKEKGSASFYNSMLAYLNVMRHITGLSKVQNVAENVLQFLNDTERKICIFVHHHDVANSLELALNEGLKGTGVKVMQYKSGTAPDEKEAIQARFNEVGNQYRVLIASTLAAGEGLNLQYACNDAIMMERQWNPPNEQQAEDRFHRIGQTLPVTVDYPLVLGTVDEFFTEVVEKKRKILGEINNDNSEWQESKVMTEMMEQLYRRGRDKWTKKKTVAKAKK